MTECHCPHDLEAPPRATRDLNPTSHEIRRRRRLARAPAALDLMRDPQDPDPLMTFDRREQGAVGLIRDLKVWLLPSPFPTDSAARPDESRRIV